uniref:Guanine nucleotide-binding protein subunit beta-like protein n=1 Tax=Percolomonas cosmopolitus TaxID=63605 RepID=A0A7S1KLN1_9EUKA|mmetsp:Transcript_10706/g.40059  ORF Transcript_10706/g.40059 Transcript_10706/m.40059 type:complete len:1366 (+) Transcript_10706:143-4240(+)
MPQLLIPIQSKASLVWSLHTAVMRPSPHVEESTSMHENNNNNHSSPNHTFSSSSSTDSVETSSFSSVDDGNESDSALSVDERNEHAQRRSRKMKFSKQSQESVTMGHQKRNILPYELVLEDNEASQQQHAKDEYRRQKAHQKIFHHQHHRQSISIHSWKSKSPIHTIPLHKYLFENEIILTMAYWREDSRESRNGQQQVKSLALQHHNEPHGLVWLGSSWGRIFIFSVRRRECISIVDLFQREETVESSNNIEEAPRHHRHHEHMYGQREPPHSASASIAMGAYANSTIRGRRSLGGKLKINPTTTHHQQHNHHHRHTSKRTHFNVVSGISNIFFQEMTLFPDDETLGAREQMAFISLCNGSLYQVDASTFDVVQRFEGLHSAKISCLAVYSSPSALVDSSTILSTSQFHHSPSSGLFSPSPKRHQAPPLHSSPNREHGFHNNLSHISRVSSHSDHSFLPTDSSFVYIITASEDGCVKFWRFNRETLFCFQTIDNLYAQDLLIVRGQQNTDISAQTSSTSLWIAGDDSQIHVWDLSNFNKRQVLDVHTSTVNCLCQLDGEVWSASMDQSICVWEASTGRLLKQISTGDSFVRHLVPVAKASVYRLWSVNESNDKTISTQMWDAQNSFEFIVKMSQLSQVVAETERENAMLSDSLNQSMEQSQLLKSVNEQLRHRMTHLEDSLRVLRDDDAKQLQSVSQLNESLQDTTLRLESTNAENQELRTELETLRQAQKEHQKTEKSLHSALKSIEKQRRSTEELEMRNRSLEERISEYKDQISALQHDLAHKTISLENLKDEMGAVVDELKESKERKFQLEAGNSYLEMQFNTSEAVLHKVTRAIRETLFDEDNGEDSDDKSDSVPQVDYAFLRDNIDAFTKRVKKYQDLDKICLAYRQTLDDMLRDMEETKRILLNEEPIDETESQSNKGQIRSLRDTFHAFSVALETLSEHYLKEKQESRSTIESQQEELSQVTNELVQVNAELRETTAKVEREEKAHHIIDKLMKQASNVVLNSFSDTISSTLEQKLNVLTQLWTRHSEKQKQLISEITVLDNTINDMVELMNQFVKSLPDLDINPNMFDQAESSALKAIMKELKRSSKFIGKSYSKQSIAEEIFFGEEVALPTEANHALKNGSLVHTPKPRKGANLNHSRFVGFSSTPTKKGSRNIHFDGTIHTDLRRTPFNNSPKITKTSNATIIRHALPSPHTRADSPLKATVDVTPAEPSLEFKQHLLRLKVAENCLRIAHLYRQVEVAEELRYQDEKEVKRCTEEKMKLVDTDHYKGYIIKQTVEVLHNMLHVCVERSQVQVSAFSTIHNEENHQKLLRTLEYMQKSLEKIVLTLLERHEECRTKLQALKLRSLNASLKKKGG